MLAHAASMHLQPQPNKSLVEEIWTDAVKIVSAQRSGHTEDVCKQLRKPSTKDYKLWEPSKTSFAQNLQDETVAKVLNLTNGFFVESGAADGEWNSNTLHLERDLGWTGLLVEPSPFTFQKPWVRIGKPGHTKELCQPQALLEK